MGFCRGDAVEVFGLESDKGRKLNGQTGSVMRYISEKSRFEVCFSEDRRIELKPENLKRLDCHPGDFSSGDSVEVWGLESEQGGQLNGKRGTVVRRVEGTTPLRLEVRIQQGPGSSDARLVNLKPGNLRRVPPSDRRAPEVEPSKVPPGMSFRGLRASGKAAGTDAGPQAHRTPALRPGDLVEVSGLTSKEGQQLNGQQAVVTGHDDVRQRVEVRFDELGGKVQSLKSQNLRKLDLMIGDLVEVIGLESQSGQKLNGDKGTIKRYIDETARWEVQFIPYRLIALKAENLQRVDTAPFEGRV